jgi:hypothetical protein
MMAGCALIGEFAPLAAVAAQPDLLNDRFGEDRPAGVGRSRSVPSR